jgi:hypothetical protein
MLSQRTSGPAAAQHQLASCRNATEQCLRGRGDGSGESFGGLRQQVGIVEELLLNALFEHGHG